MRRTLSISLASLLLLTMLTSTVLAWELDRPKDDVELKEERCDTFNTDAKASVGLGVHIAKFYNNDPYFPAYGRDYIKLWIIATANTRRITAYGVKDSGVDTDYAWHDVTHDVLSNWTGNFDDGFGHIYLDPSKTVDLHFPRPVRFYGGVKSAEYRHIYVSANGFISFEPLSAPTPKYYSKNIPDTDEPNLFIAPFWRDLHIGEGSSITWGIVQHIAWDPGVGTYTGAWCHVISWNNVLDKNGAQQSFQIVLEEAHYADDPWDPIPVLSGNQSRIWFQYKTVTTGDATSVGIEDQGGWRGVSYNYQNLGNGKTLVFEQTSHSAFIKNITIKLNRGSDANALICIEPSSESMRGHNVKLKSEEPDPQARFQTALAGTSTLLYDVWAFVPGFGLLSPVGLIFGTTLVILDWAEWYVGRLKPADPLPIVDDGTPDLPHPVDVSYAKAETPEAFPDYSLPLTVVDASFGITVYWIFDDPEENQTHDLTITAEVEYVETNYLNAVATTTIKTEEPVKLRMEPDIGNTFGDPYVKTAKKIAKYKGCLDENDPFDMYVIDLEIDDIIKLKMTPVGDPQGTADYNLYLYNPAKKEVNSSEQPGSATESITYTANSTGRWYIGVSRFAWKGIYILEIDTSNIADLNWDHTVDIFDLIIVGAAFGSEPGSPNWNIAADINKDNTVDIFDLVIVGARFGKTYKPDPPPPQGTTLVSVNPAEITVGKYENFSVNVTVTNATNMYGYEFKLYYNASVLNCTDVTLPPNHFLNPILNPNNIYIAKQEYNNTYNATHGRVWVAATLQNPEQPKNGSGTLATINFMAIATGNSALKLQDVKLGNMQAEAIPNTPVDGSATVAPPRYMRGDTHTINGLTAYQLSTFQSNITKSAATSKSGSCILYCGIRVWVRHADGNETELTGGTPVAQVSRSSDGEGIQSSTWNCPEALLATTDAIIVRVYIKLGTNSWNLAASFVTEQLNATNLNSATWTVYYYTKRNYRPAYHAPGTTVGTFYWGTITYNSHIEHVGYT